MMKVGDSSGRVYLNPAYRGFLAQSHINLRGVAADLFFISVGSDSGGIGLFTAGTATGATVAQITRYAGGALAAGGAALTLLESGLVDHSQKMTVAARATAEKKAVGQRS